MSPPSTFVLRRAQIYTMNGPSQASALAIRNGRVAAVGNDHDVWAAVGSDVPSVDLGGRVVLPGLTDAHVHWADHALARQRVQIEPDQSLPAALKRVRDRAASSPTGEGWIVGRGWDHTSWGRWPTAADLDVATADRPVALTRKDGHAIWLNTAALTFAGVGASTPDPPGGEIVRREGEPTGVLKENAIRLVQQAIPAPSPADRQAAIFDAWPEAWCQGLTGCHDMGFSPGGSLFRDLSTLRDAGKLGLRFVWYMRRQTLDEAIALGLSSGLGDDWLRVGGLKLFLDGTLGSQTAEMLGPYEGEPGGLGIATLEFEEYFELVRRAAAAGLATAVHAIGDAANRKALDGFARLLIDPPARAHALRHRIEHAQVVDPADAPRFAVLGVVASMQPIHATADRFVADRSWGTRAADSYAWRTLLDHGTRLAFGSDSPIETLNVFAGIHAAVTRQDPEGKPPGGWYPEQRVSAYEAVASYTMGPAWAAGQEKTLGSLASGKQADLIVLDRSPFTVPATELIQTRVLATMIEGVWVWQAQDVDLGGPRHDP